MQSVASLCVLVIAISVVVLTTTSVTEAGKGLGNQVADSNKNRNMKIVCYFTQWTKWRQGVGKYTADNVDPQLCTHIIFAFAKIVNYKLVPLEDDDINVYQQLVKLKTTNSNLKILISVGGETADPSSFKMITSSANDRKQFASNAIRFLRSYGFDGIDLDWEFPSGQDKKNFALLVEELRRAFEADKVKPRLILTAAVGVSPEKMEAGYDIPALSRNVDFFNLMTYNLRGQWDHRTGHNALLYPLSTDSPYLKELTVAHITSMWESMGAPKDKLVVGIAMYGGSFTLTNPANNGIGAPAYAGQPGEFTKAAGMLAYYEVCQMLKNGAQYVWNDEMQVPYAVKGNQWVGFDDERSIRSKTDFIKKKGYAGAMIWSLDMDDFTGTMCGKGVKYPLLTTIKNTLGGNGTKADSTSTTKVSVNNRTTGPKKPPSTKTPRPGGVCEEGKLYPHEKDCHKYYECADGKKFPRPCGHGTAFNPVIGVCDHPQNVENCKKSTKSSEICEHGKYIPHETDCRKFYHCSHGKKYPKTCGHKTVFNPTINVCDYPWNVEGCENYD